MIRKRRHWIELIDANNNLVDLVKQCNAARNRLDQLRKALTEHEAAKKTLMQQLNVIQIEQYRGHTSEQIEVEKAKILEEYDHIEKEFNLVSEQLSTGRSEKERIQTRLNQIVLNGNVRNRQLCLEIKLLQTPPLNSKHLKRLSRS